MLQSIKKLQGCQILATDGAIGSVHDFYFDDERWAVRYLVVDTGSWLPGRRVLISPIAIQTADWINDTLSLKITRDQVKNSPDIDTHKPVSRQQEGAHFRYYGYPYYWGGSELWGPAPYPSSLSARQMAEVDQDIRAEQDYVRAQGDEHLRHTKEVIGHHILATDGELGHVADFLVDAESWAIRYVVVDTSNWWFGQKVLVAPAWISDIRWIDKKVTVDLTRQSVKNSPRYDEAAQFDRQWESSYYSHYERVPYWSTEKSADEPAHRDADLSAAAATLVSLNTDGGFEVADEDQDPRGWDISAADGHKIGKVDDLILDTSTMKVRYLDIDVDRDERHPQGESTDRHILLPVSLASIGDGGKQVTVRVLNADDLARVPAYRSLPVAPDYEEQFVGQVRDHGARERAKDAWSIGARKTADRTGGARG